jgi:ataxia telangiectasia mutated family protein
MIREFLCCYCFGIGLQADRVERMATRFITLANLAIIHSECRRGAYWHLLSVSFYNSKYTSYLRVVLEAVASRLGMDSLGELFESHAAQVAVHVRRIDQDLIALPSSLLGFRDRKECVDKTFSKVLPCLLLARDPSTTQSLLEDQYFQNYCRSVNLDPVDTLSKCFADLVGLRIVFTYDSFGTQDPALQDGQASAMMQWIKLCLQDCGVRESYFLLHGDRIAAAILKCLWDHDYSINGRIEAGLQEAKGADAVQTFRSLMQYRTHEDFPMHQPSPPGIDTRQTLHSMFWLGTQNGAVYGKPEMTYHILHQLFAAINATPLVNEQLRLLHGMAVWISIKSDHFNDTVLRRSLLTNTIHLLAQIDLARVSQSILGWVFTKYRGSSQIHIRADSENLDTALMRISAIASDYEASNDTYTSKVGSELLDWVESEIVLLHSCPPLRSAVLTALTLWPRQLVKPIATLATNLSDVRHLTRLLRQEDRLQGKFRLTRQFVALPNYSKESFSRDHFWALKQCIPTGVHLRDEDIDAFLQLLYISGGVLEGARPRHFNDGDSFLARHRHTGGLELKEKLPAIKALVIDIVQARLSSNDSRSSQIAYSTLRQLLHSKCVTAEEANAVKKGQELLFISNRALDPLIRPSRSLVEMKRDPFLDAAQAYDGWIKNTTLLLADALALSDLFWAQLADFIQVDSSFARELFPILVHQLLETMPESKASISSAFKTVLESELSSVACQKAIVDTVLHLRWFQNHGPLGHDNWLALDYTLLSRAAIRCGAYTTAVMFIELAHEHTKVMNAAWSQDVEEMLYEVYSHIDEPDGFYAIPSRDTKQYLVRKFHHERNWDNAFQFHGAAYEAASTNITASQGILESLHAFGFDRLAMSMGQSSRPNSALDVDYALAWRTGTWDLPLRQSSDLPSATLYGVLRAVHRGRDPIVTDNALRVAIRVEMERLRAAGDENMAEIRRSTQSLLCLREVKYWRKDRIQSSLQLRKLVSNDWETFRQLPDGFE